jgi:hypothetical protein
MTGNSAEKLQAPKTCWVLPHYRKMDARSQKRNPGDSRSAGQRARIQQE